MITANIYLNFDGNCEEAFLFYRSVFGGDFSYVGRYKDMPQQEGAPTMPETMKEKIMHISLPISRETMIMGSDIGGEWASAFKAGNNFTVSINTDDKALAEKVFNGLAQGGTITMPLNFTFWGDYFGMLTDAYGINWMISFNAGQGK